jgi:hypothetical protein
LLANAFEANNMPMMVTGSLGQSAALAAVRDIFHPAILILASTR